MRTGEAVQPPCAFWGNSAETMVAQLVAEEFDVEPQNVNIVYSGSTAACRPRVLEAAALP